MINELPTISWLNSRTNFPVNSLPSRDGIAQIQETRRQRVEYDNDSLASIIGLHPEIDDTSENVQHNHKVCSTILSAFYSYFN